jgi:pyruvate formate lyase activating enzyme
MILGGIEKNSFIDYPGKISCVLFTAGCNFTCPYCHNPLLAKGMRPQPLSDRQACALLTERRGFLEAVVISGGEPTLQADLTGFCRAVKALGYPLKLDTNGSRPAVLKALIEEGLLDYVAMDIKTEPCAYLPHISPFDVGSHILASIELLLAGAVPYEFRTTCVKPFVSAKIIAAICPRIQGARQYVLQRVRCGHVLAADFFNNGGHDFSQAELEDLQAAAAPWVQTCLIR